MEPSCKEVGVRNKKFICNLDNCSLSYSTVPQIGVSAHWREDLVLGVKTRGWKYGGNFLG